MLKDNLPAGNAFRSRRTDIILSHNVKHAGLGKTRNISHWICCQRNDRKDIILMIGIPYRYPLQLDTEHQQQQRGKHETGQGRKQGWKKDNQTVRKLISRQSRKAAENKT